MTLVERLGADRSRLHLRHESGPGAGNSHAHHRYGAATTTGVSPAAWPDLSGEERLGLTTVRFEHPAQQPVLQDHTHAVTDAEARIEQLTGQIADLLPDWSLAPVVEAVQSMRSVAFIVAVTVVAGVGDLHRFDNPRQPIAYLGLTPSEHSSSASVRRGGITKAGSGLARRVLIEGAWSHRMRARVSRRLHDRIEGLPKAVRDIAWRGQSRMCQRYRPLVTAGKAEVVVITATAREMVGFIRAIARAVTAPPAMTPRTQG